PEVTAWPLTGLPLEDPAAVANPVVGIKVENSGPARPWIGLAGADLVFVEMVEGGVTRFHAVYHSQFPEIVGPVRSLRPMDAAILGQWDGTLLASGGQPQFIARVESAVGLRTLDRGDVGFYRQSGRRAPHNVMADMTSIVPTLPASTEILPIASYGEEPSSLGGAPAVTAHMTYPGTRSVWTFDPESGVYFRTDAGSPSVDVDGTQMSAKNVLVLRVQTQNTGALDPGGAPVPETILSGAGELVYFQGGAVATGTWSKGGDNDPFELTDAEGNPLVLAPGITWIELLPVQGSLSWE
ncbi:MAG: DUF3048 domain-containing protein, partial [bacterium]|nr:DUF3048 domain-containing protein [bacterium]